MIRGIISSLTTRAAFSFASTPNRKEIFNSISKCLPDKQRANFTSVAPLTGVAVSPFQCIPKHTNSALLKPLLIPSEQIRTVIKFSIKKGKRQSVKAVLHRFYRLHWGAWIRTIAGRRKKLWKKSASQRNRYRHHVFCNATQSRMLDKMVTKFWRKPRYYIDDPYECYHKRENFYFTQTKPWRPEGVDYE